MHDRSQGISVEASIERMTADGVDNSGDLDRSLIGA